MTDSFALIPASYVFMLRHDRGDAEVLLQLRANTGWMDGHWAAGVAGHVDKGETAVEAAIREGREELGVELLDLRFEVCMQQTRRSGPIDERIDFFFTGRRWRGEPRIMEPERCDDLRWFSLSRLPANLVDYERAALRSIGAGEHYVAFGF